MLAQRKDAEGTPGLHSRIRDLVDEGTPRGRRPSTLVPVIRDETASPRSASVLRALATYGQALERLRYGSFRGVVKEGKLVLFAIEEEWRPTVEGGNKCGKG